MKTTIYALAITAIVLLVAAFALYDDYKSHPGEILQEVTTPK